MDAVTNADQSGQQQLLDAHLVVAVDAGRKNHQSTCSGATSSRTAPGGADDGDVSAHGDLDGARLPRRKLRRGQLRRDRRRDRHVHVHQLPSSATGGSIGSGSAAGWPRARPVSGAVFKVRKTNLAGATVVMDLGAIPTQNPNQATISVEGYIARTAGTGDVVHRPWWSRSTSLRPGRSPGPAGHTSPRGVLIEDVGAEGPWFGPIHVHLKEGQCLPSPAAKFSAARRACGRRRESAYSQQDLHHPDGYRQ
jgi:hypothetical protein